MPVRLFLIAALALVAATSLPACADNQGCEADGCTFQDGDAWTDGCNTCWCDVRGLTTTVACTEKGCVGDWDTDLSCEERLIAED